MSYHPNDLNNFLPQANNSPASYLDMARYGTQQAFPGQPSLGAAPPAPLNFTGTSQQLGNSPAGILESFKSWGSKLLGEGPDENGYQSLSPLMQGLGVTTGLANTYLGMKQYGLAKDAFKQNKREFDLNFGAQSNLTNSRLEDRQRARVASNSGGYQSVGDYMGQYRVGS